MFSEVLKASPLDRIRDELPKILALVTSMDHIKSPNSNTMIRKYKVKIVSRVGLRMLPPNPNAGRRKGGRCVSFVSRYFLIYFTPPGKTLTGEEAETQETGLLESDVPEEIEQILEELLQSLEDKVNAWLYSP